MKTLVASLVGLLLVTSFVRADDWPQWRGANHNGISNEKNIPAVWGEDKNIAWKVPMPGRGGATPIIWKDRLFTTSGDGNDLVLLCLNTNGKLVWKKNLGPAGRVAIKGDEANESSATPCTDGKHVWAFVGSGVFACFDMDGKEVWKFNVQDRYGKFKILHGIHNTPLLHGDKLYVNLLHTNAHLVIALDKATGKEVWKVARNSDAQFESKDSYASPTLWQDGKDAYLVVLGNDYVTGHRLSDGSEIWRVGDINPKSNYQAAFRIIASPVASADVILSPTARQKQVIAIDPKASGFIKAGAAGEKWRLAKGSPDVPSPLVHDGLVYLCSELGVLACVDAKSGKQLYQETLHRNRYRGSPIFVDGKIICTSRDGVFSVVKAGPKFELISQNSLPDAFTASPAVANGRIYLRGFENLYCIEEKK